MLYIEWFLLFFRYVTVMDLAIVYAVKTTMKVLEQNRILDWICFLLNFGILFSFSFQFFKCNRPVTFPEMFYCLSTFVRSTSNWKHWCKVSEWIVLWYWTVKDEVASLFFVHMHVSVKCYTMSGASSVVLMLTELISIRDRVPWLTAVCFLPE